MQFRLRTMLIAVSIVAVTFVAMPTLYDWFANPPSISLSSAVREFNESTGTRSTQTGMTEVEVVAEINSQLPTLVAAVRDKQILKRIVEKQRVPPSTKIECISLGQQGRTINLSFRRGAISGVPRSGVPFSLTLRHSSDGE